MPLIREFWALSSRNEAISQSLDDYYQAYSDALFRILEPVAINPSAAQRAVIFLIPWFEGYSITHHGMYADEQVVRDMVCETLVAILLGKVGA